MHIFISLYFSNLLSLCLLLTTLSCSSQANWLSTPQDENSGGTSPLSSPNGVFADPNIPNPSVHPHGNTAYSLLDSPDFPVGLLPDEEAVTNGQIASSETSSGVPNPNNAADPQSMAFQEGDSGANLFPWNLIRPLDGFKLWNHLHRPGDEIPLPTITNDYPSPQAGRYNDNERLADPKYPECDGGKHAMCCSVAAPMQPLAAHNLHKRRRCFLFDPTTEECHWRQNIYCCACRTDDRYRMGVGCYAYWYRNNPSYIQTSPDPSLQYPAPRRFDTTKSDKDITTPFLLGVHNQAEGEQITKQSRERPTRKEPEKDVCSEDELNYWEQFGRPRRSNV